MRDTVWVVLFAVCLAFIGFQFGRYYDDTASKDTIQYLSEANAACYDKLKNRKLATP